MTNFQGKITDISIAGLGVTKHPDGRTFFVAGAFPGDEGRFAITRQTKRYGFASLVEILVASSMRMPSPCSYQGQGIHSCGGCPWMPLPYEKQLHWKDQRIRQALERDDILSPSTKIHPIHPSPKQLGYRNRAQPKTDGEELGFLGNQSSRLIDIESCLVLNEETATLWDGLRRSLPRLDWRGESAEPWLSLEIDDQMHIDHVAPRKKLAFRQANDEQNIFMKSWLTNTLNDLKPRNTLELFSGEGNFTSLIADHSRQILAIDCADGPIAALKQKDLLGVQAKCLDLFRSASIAAVAKQGSKADLLVLDPPRSGLQLLPQYLEALPQLKSLIYISCDLLTYCRDAKKIAAKGWRLEAIQPVDQFPQTPHIEILSLFSRGNRTGEE